MIKITLTMLLLMVSSFVYACDIAILKFVNIKGDTITLCVEDIVSVDDQQGILTLNKNALELMSSINGKVKKVFYLNRQGIWEELVMRDARAAELRLDVNYINHNKGDFFYSSKYGIKTLGWFVYSLTERYNIPLKR